MLDIYFNRQYGRLCEFVDHGISELFTLTTENGTIENMFIRRPAPWLVDGVQYYDIVTPYGYGGPVVTEVKDKDSLIRDYASQFEKYCERENIVCEFIRYHPIYRNWEGFSDVYEIVFSRKTVGTNLADFDDPVGSEFSKSARKEIRKATHAGVTCVTIPHPDNLTAFRRLYEDTMDRNNAAAMYYFPDEYYQLLTTELRSAVLEIQAFHEGRTIASEIYFIQGDIMHAHLLGSDDSLLKLNGGALIEATAAEWGKKNGYRYIHHGGGRTSAPDDPLFLYKKKFGKNTEFDFTIGKRVWNKEVYLKLLLKRQEQGPIEDNCFFPAYRAN